ncbi:MAG: aromatic ring-hydroxylating dioxygenase subunit alpha [Candidatus Binataceae bacterium]|nr:aromatic ring-hydroxylating dioxygenase subunit alpha [Candidatus Binataceae bacterium]
MAGAAIDYQDLVRRDQVHARLYYDPAIFEEEMDKIFSHHWVYVGHESEVAEPGEFVCRWLGLQPVILVRDRKRQLHLLMNRCRHRSNTICQVERGNAAGGFRCAYHGWTYSPSGELTGLPYSVGYDSRDFRKEDYGLIRVTIESCHGFIFGNLNPGGHSLLAQIGAARPLLEQVINLAPAGEVMLRAGLLKHKYRANWKMTMENVLDAYHPPVLHQTAFHLGTGKSFNWDSVYGPEGNARTRDLGNGNGQIDFNAQNRKSGFFFQGLKGDIDESAQRAYHAGLAKRLGQERVAQVLGDSDPHFSIFPNFNYLPPGQVRLIRPVSIDETHIYYFPVMLKDAPIEINRERIRRSGYMHGPAGLVAPDDIDVYERNQEALKARQDEWVILRRGLRTEQREEDGSIVGMAYEETTQRGLWRHYRQLMTRDANGAI